MDDDLRVYVEQAFEQVKRIQQCAERIERAETDEVWMWPHAVWILKFTVPMPATMMIG